MDRNLIRQEVFKTYQNMAELNRQKNSIHSLMFSYSKEELKTSILKLSSRSVGWILSTLTLSFERRFFLIDLSIYTTVDIVLNPHRMEESHPIPSKCVWMGIITGKFIWPFFSDKIGIQIFILCEKIVPTLINLFLNQV